MSAQVFLQWWGEQLAAWIPPGLRQRLQAQHTLLQLQETGNGPILSLQHHGKQQPLDTAQLQQQLADLPTPEGIVLSLNPGQYLSRTVDLPLAAADNLEQAIGYQIETLTPFRREQLWLFCGEQQRLADGKRLRAWLVAVPRRAAKPLQDLALIDHDACPQRGPRLAPEENARVELRFRPARQGRPKLASGWLLAGANLALLGLAIGLHLDNRQAELDGLRSQARSLQQQAVVASDLAREVEQLEDRAQQLLQLRRRHPTSVALLDEVSQRVDDLTWLQRFELRQGSLRLQGTSANASALIARLDRSPLLADVRFDASLTRDPRGGGERFNLTGKLRQLSADNSAGTQP